MIYFLLGYIFLQFAIGYWASRRIKNEADYLLAGRHVPAWLLTFSLFATWFGAETCIGTAGQVYEQGISGGRADPFGYTICLILLGVLVAGKIWKKNYSTLADFYRDRYGVSVERLAGGILLISSMVWGAAQLRAFGQIISATTAFPVEATMVIAFVLVVAYSLLGGLMADIWTDFIQGLVLVIGLIVLLVAIFNQEGFEILKQDPARLSLLAEGESWWARIDRWAIPIMGSLIAQESISRVLAARSSQVARQSAYWASGIYLIVGFIPVLIGLVGPEVLSDVGDKEHYLIAVTQKYLNPVGQYLLVGALLSAILSTIDSVLLAGGALLSHNFILPMSKIKTDKRKLFYSRLGVFLMASAAFVVAWFSEGIYELVEAASSFVGAGILVVTLFGLWSQWGGKITAITALIVGVVSVPLFEYVLELEAPFVATILLVFAVYLVGGSIEEKKYNSKSASLS